MENYFEDNFILKTYQRNEKFKKKDYYARIYKLI